MTDRNWTDWETTYRDHDPRTLPWFRESLDEDVARALDKLALVTGTILDIGAGAGTQAVALARLGFKVTGIDVSAAAVNIARSFASAHETNVEFLKMNILNSAWKSDIFDILLDRGCFHQFGADSWGRYAEVCARILKPGGVLLLKCFGPGAYTENGPHCFYPQQIERTFDGNLVVETIEQCKFDHPGHRSYPAIFCTLRKPLFGPAGIVALEAAKNAHGRTRSSTV